jgi:hypothetical protein
MGDQAAKNWPAQEKSMQSQLLARTGLTTSTQPTAPLIRFGFDFAYGILGKGYNGAWVVLDLINFWIGM